MDYRQSTGRSRLLDALRGLAACYVMLHHAYCTVYPSLLPAGTTPPVLGPMDTALTVFFRAGSTAVALFIAISGFSLMLPLLDADRAINAPVFYLRRFWRIAPPYYAGLFLSALLGMTLLGAPTGSHWDNFIPFSHKDIVQHIFFLHDFAPNAQKINGAYWSIAVEMQIYLFFPLLALAYRRLPWRQACILILAFGFLAFALNKFFPFCPPSGSLYLTFATGMIGAIMAHHLPAHILTARRMRMMHALCLIGLALFFGLRISGMIYKNFPLDYLIVCAFLGLMILEQRLSAAPLPAGIRHLARSPFAGLGLFAYSLYLIHEPFQQLIWQYGIRLITDSKPAQFLLLVPASLAIVIPAAYGFFYVFERPFLDKKWFNGVLSRLSAVQSPIFALALASGKSRNPDLR